MSDYIYHGDKLSKKEKMKIYTIDEIRPEIRELVVAWKETTYMDLRDTVKLASDIQNLMEQKDAKLTRMKRALIRITQSVKSSTEAYIIAQDGLIDGPGTEVLSPDGKDAEIARLREALEKIVNQFERVDPLYPKDKQLIAIAREALNKEK